MRLGEAGGRETSEEATAMVLARDSEPLTGAVTVLGWDPAGYSVLGGEGETGMISAIQSLLHNRIQNAEHKP